MLRSLTYALAQIRQGEALSLSQASLCWIRQSKIRSLLRSGSQINLPSTLMKVPPAAGVGSPISGLPGAGDSGNYGVPSASVSGISGVPAAGVSGISGVLGVGCGPRLGVHSKSPQMRLPTIL